ncbi:DM13 domain-containing protein [Candidatus Micrarchaeota archaeon]|nr:DM13 domain-containing protein [Candidatus Micrarchaeota archaeon]
MKTIFLATCLAAIFLSGCTQSEPSAASATPFAQSITPAQDGVVTQDIQKKMDDVTKASGSTAVEKNTMTQDERDAMAQKSQTGNTLAGPNDFRRVQYDMKGSATIIERDGKKYLAFSKDFSTKSGPRLVVRLSNNAEPTSPSALDGSKNVLLHDLIDVNGYQEYELPSDYADFETVIVFCEPFRVIWGYASLK